MRRTFYIYYWLATVVIFAITLWAQFALADQSSINGVDRHVMFAGQVVAPSGTATSPVFYEMGRATTQTLQISTSTSGGDPNLAIVILASVDEVGFAAPSVGATPTTITKDGTYIVPLGIPMCSAIKIKLVDLSGSVTTTVNVTCASQ